MAAHNSAWLEYMTFNHGVPGSNPGARIRSKHERRNNGSITMAI